FVSGKFAYVTAFTGDRLTIVELSGLDVPTVLTGSLQTTTLDTWSFANIGSDLYVRGGIVGGSGGIMTNGAFSVSATTTQTAGGGTFFSINPFPETWPVGTSSVTSTPFIQASSTVTVSNFFAATATSLTSGDFFKLTVPSASFTGDVFKVQTNASTPVNLFRLDNAGSIISSSTATTANFFTASATAITSGDLFRGVLGAGATANSNFLSFSMGETPNNRRFALNSQGSISASSTVTGTNFFNVTATAITTGDLFKFTVPGSTGTGQAWTGNILTVQNNTTSLNVTTPQTLLTISSTGSLTINNATTSMTVKGSVNDATNLNLPTSVFVSGRYAYVSAWSGNRLTVVDVSNPSSPTVVGSVNDAVNLNGPVSVFVSGRYACSIIDATNLSSAQYVFVSGRYAYVAAQGGNRFTVVDVSNPTSPIVVGSVNDATNLNSPTSVFVSGRYVYVSANTGNRLTVVDVSNPSSPTVVGSVNDATNLAGARSVFVSGRYAYVAAYSGKRLTVVDVSNPASPTVTGSVNDATNLNGPYSVYVSGRYAYVAAQDGNRFTAVDVSTPASPTVVGSVYDATNLSAPYSVFVSGRYAYAAAGNGNRLTIVELPGLDVPTVLTGSLQTTTLDTWSFANIGSDLYVRGGIVGGPGGIMTNGAFSVSATTTQTAGGGTFFSINP
ncbi:hypothetical protein HYW68_01590, partial [Candidatus Parcubacteria bacterium]|nr:hypothetical protein [Candidatus Parcubacteria bacterium]